MTPALGRSGRPAPGVGAVAALAIVGPTASGKSALALALAGRHPHLEVVSVDSMQVYRGMDIGTAKPTPAERAEVPHHLLDLVEPEDDFDLTRFQAEAATALAAIAARGHRAVLVGGTGLYLRGLLDGLTPPGTWPEVRADVEAEPDTAALHTRLVALDPAAAARMEPGNRRRVVRALEVCLGSGRPFSSFGPGLGAYPASPVPQVGLRYPRDELTARIAAGFDAQLAAGLVDEVAALAARPGSLSRTAGQALGYRELLAHGRGECSQEEAVALALSRTGRFAVRQERWFRRDPRIVWLDAANNPMAALVPVVEALAPVQLTKHHGLGNDFLVALDPDRPLGPAEARRWCDRHRGVGADGLLVGTAPADDDHDADLVMTLWNADGTRAEMSGNGIRCLVQAHLQRRGEVATEAHVRVRTDAGVRLVTSCPTEDRATVWASVDMGAATVEVVDDDSCLVELGNPHLVRRHGDVEALGRQHPDLNVEVITVVARDHLRMVVHERGVGLTEACGTGACASAAAARAWGLVDDDVRVDMPGGAVDVTLRPSVVLRGPATFVATVEVAHS